MGALALSGSSRITLRARFRSTEIANSNLITIEQSRLGGTDTDRTLDNLIHVSAKSDDVVIRDNDIGFTSADRTGNTGYGIRAFHGDRMQIVRNSFHNIGADAMQLGMDADLLIDRNEVAYTARPADSDEHSDDLQLISNGPNTRITNNYFHHCGWLSPPDPPPAATPKPCTPAPPTACCSRTTSRCTPSASPSSATSAPAAPAARTPPGATTPGGTTAPNSPTSPTSNSASNPAPTTPGNATSSSPR